MGTREILDGFVEILILNDIILKETISHNLIKTTRIVTVIYDIKSTGVTEIFLFDIAGLKEV